MTAFDTIAQTYERELQRGLAVSGETPRHFAERRVAWLARRLARRRFTPRRVLDFGCGTGGSSALLRERLGAAEVLGVDVSAPSLEVARRRHRGAGFAFVPPGELAGAEPVDLAFCNGVFHHVPPPERHLALAAIRGALRPGGMFAFFENNPWNPGTRWIMSRLSFDRDAVPIGPAAARRLLAGARFELLAVDHLFLFPRWLSWLRPLEPLAAPLPLGAQYLVLAQRP